jgi:ATP/maltotriose-dependent transcriptional regulator MalT
VIRLLALLLFAGSASALSPEAKEFMTITGKLEPVQCDKRKLRREIALAEAENRSSGALRERFAALNRDARTAKLERRLAELEPKLERSSDPEDLAAISRQQREAFYRCD